MPTPHFYSAIKYLWLKLYGELIIRSVRANGNNHSNAVIGCAARHAISSSTPIHATKSNENRKYLPHGERCLIQLEDAIRPPYPSSIAHAERSPH